MRSSDATRTAGWPAIRNRLLGVALVLAAAWVLWDREQAIDPEALWQVARQTQPWQWAAALAATLLSFAALGRYDRLVHGWLGTGICGRAAGRSGMAAIAVSQMAGMGLVTGALVRWRCLPALGPGGAARVTAAVTASFMGGWAAVCALAVAASPALPASWRLAAALALALALAGALAAATRPERGPWRALPGLPFLARALGLVALDTGAAALALWAFCPDLPLAALLPAYLLALGAGLVASTPGGLGAFELAMLALLPAAAPEPLLAGILCFRVAYHALPAALAGLAVLLRPALFAAARPRPGLDDPGAAARAAPQAEAQLVRLPGNQPLAGPGGVALGTLARTRQCAVLLGEPWRRGAILPAARALRAAAREAGTVAAIYKVGPRSAVALRLAGWRLLAVSEEAVLDPAAHDAARPACRQLRRKLKKARAAGVEVSRAGDTLPLDEMARVAADWAAAQGGERGFSMGRFEAGYVAGQQVWLARVGGRLVGFATFHRGAEERTLDLMRPGPEAPDGTMHLLVEAAIAAARAEGAARLSLAAAPLEAPAAATPLARAVHRLCAPNRGLRQFKAAFAPRWDRRYLAAPSHAALLLAAADIARAVARPAPLPAGPAPAPAAPLASPASPS